MRINLFVRTTLLLAAMTGCGVYAQSPGYDVHSLFTTHTDTQIPGQNLKPGSYSIHIVDQLRDRYIVRVDDTRGNPVSTFIALRNPDFSASKTQGPVEWSNASGKKVALRGFVFPKNVTVEFVYPKSEAVELAKLNDSTVPAIDPQSEGRPLAFKLSEADRQVVTLWMLRPTRVGTGKGTPAIEAERFQAQPDTELAENSPPSAPSALSASNGQAVIAPAQPYSSFGAQARTDPNDNTRSRSIGARLPQTASNLPLVLLVSCFLLIGGLGLSAYRRFLPQS